MSLEMNEIINCIDRTANKILVDNPKYDARIVNDICTTIENEIFKLNIRKLDDYIKETVNANQM